MIVIPYRFGKSPSALGFECKAFGCIAVSPVGEDVLSKEFCASEMLSLDHL